MPKKTIELTTDPGYNEAAINKEGFPKIKKAVSRSTAFRYSKKKKQIDCDPACDVKGRKAMAGVLFDEYGKWNNEKSICNLEKSGMPYVLIGDRQRGYCVESCFHHIDTIHLQAVREQKLKNLKGRSGIFVATSSKR
jgi:hypothetical protein